MNDSSKQEQPRLYQNQWAREAKVWSVKRQFCDCVDDPKPGEERRDLTLHLAEQDTQCRGWQRLLELIDEAAADGREEFSPARDMDPADWRQIVTLPPTIAKLKSVRHLIVYGSNFERIPPQIGEMSDLRHFTPYMSYRLHWFPYEVTRCTKLCDTRVSTRALFGNYKNRPPFPRLPQLAPAITPDRCSVCEGPFGDGGPHQAWISLRVGSDVLPLLVHACTEECLRNLPPSPERYVAGPHYGGLDLVQPPTYF
jgi:hypothetical protein